MFISLHINSIFFYFCTVGFDMLPRRLTFRMEIFDSLFFHFNDNLSQIQNLIDNKVLTMLI